MVKFGGCGDLRNVGGKAVRWYIKTNTSGGWGGGIVRRVSEKEAEACGLIEDREAIRDGKNVYLNRAIFCKRGVEY
jgi:hypothetical protein